MRAEHLETPAILINRPVFDSNMEKMARLLAPLKVALRPHYKSHKSTDIAHLQVRAGPKGSPVPRWLRRRTWRWRASRIS